MKERTWKEDFEHDREKAQKWEECRNMCFDWYVRQWLGVVDSVPGFETGPV